MLIRRRHTDAIVKLSEECRCEVAVVMMASLERQRLVFEETGLAAQAPDVKSVLIAGQGPTRGDQDGTILVPIGVI
jgi:hypothetical protein